MSNETSNSSSGGGVGFNGLLTVVFITLKLLGKIDWSWWWVFVPLWGVVVCFVVVVLAMLVYEAVTG